MDGIGKLEILKKERMGLRRSVIHWNPWKVGIYFIGIAKEKMLKSVTICLHWDRDRSFVNLPLVWALLFFMWKRPNHGKSSLRSPSHYHHLPHFLWPIKFILALTQVAIFLSFSFLFNVCGSKELNKRY